MSPILIIEDILAIVAGTVIAVGALVVIAYIGFRIACMWANLVPQGSIAAGLRKLGESLMQIARPIGEYVVTFRSGPLPREASRFGVGTVFDWCRPCNCYHMSRPFKTAGKDLRGIPFWRLMIKWRMDSEAV